MKKRIYIRYKNIIPLHWYGLWLAAFGCSTGTTDGAAFSAKHLKYKNMEFKDLESYLRAKGLKDYIDFYLDVKNELIELNIDRWYFCTVARYDNDTFEVFEGGHGATWDKKGCYITDGELWQYKVFKSLKRAIDFALKCKAKNKLPEKPIRVW